jgi:Ca-activated chloride channel family protein
VIFVKAGGNTALYDATYLAVEKVRQGRHKKKALLIISDGLENNSRYSFKEVRTQLKESDAQIFAIIMGGIGPGYMDGGTLKNLAELSGGKAFYAGDHQTMSDLYMRLALMLRHQYVLGFYPTDAESGSQWHKLRIKLQAPRRLGRLVLYYKKGYQSFR